MTRPLASLARLGVVVALLSLLPVAAEAEKPPAGPAVAKPAAAPPRRPGRHLGKARPGSKAAPDAPVPKIPPIGGALAPAAPLPAAAPANPNEPELPAVERAATDCPDKIPPGKRFKLDFRGEIELKDLLVWAQATLCRPVLVPTGIRQQKIQIYAPATTTLPEAYRIFLAALNAMGLTVQPEGNALVVIETVRAKETTVPFIGSDGKVPNDSQFVTKVMRVKDITSDEAAQVLSRIKGKDGDIVPYNQTGMLIVTDAAENVRRMEEVLRLIDVPLGSERIFTVKLRNTRATDVAALLDKVFQPKGGAGQPQNKPRGPNIAAAPGPGGQHDGSEASSVSQIIADEKTNLLIIVANDRTYLKIHGLVVRLEQSAGGPIDAAADRVHVYPLANANSEDIANTLAGLGVGVTRGASARSGSATGPVSTPTSSGVGNASGLFEGDVKVAADKPTNSLVIIAGGRDYYTLRDIIRKLDVSRRQVFIEATILEVSLDKSRKLGAAFHGGNTGLPVNGQNSLLFGGSEPNQSTNSLLFSPAALSGLAAGIRGPSIQGADTLLGLPAGTSVPSFGVYIQALQNNNDVNVVSLPHILTTDNEKANIEVGQNLPFPGNTGLGGLGALAGAAGAAAGATGLGGIGLGTSVQRQDVSLKLEITPHVNDSDLVRLEIDNEISDVSSPNYNGLGPATNKRKVKTVVVVRDQQPVVLGGLIKDRTSESVDKVPLLGDIPILGYLFKYTNKSVTKQNLLIIITPYVIKDPQDLRRIFERKVQERREFLDRFSGFRDDIDFESGVDYRHKRGLLEEINRTAVEIEREAADLRNAEQNARARQIEGPVEMPPALQAPIPVPPPPPPPASRFPKSAPPTPPAAPAPDGVPHALAPAPPPFWPQLETATASAGTARPEGSAAASSPAKGPDTTSRGEAP